MQAANVVISRVELAIVFIIGVFPISLHSHMSVFGFFVSFSALSLARSAIFTRWLVYPRVASRRHVASRTHVRSASPRNLDLAVSPLSLIMILCLCNYRLLHTSRIIPLFLSLSR